jgi:uncharacterized membrane protein YfhO
LESPPGFEPHWGVIKGKVSLKDLSTDAIEVTAETDRPCMLVLGENYSAGWKARDLANADPHDYRVVPANGFERGVPLPVGRHHFILEYRPAAFVVGKWISIVAWVFFVPVFLLTLTFRRRSQSVIMTQRKTR